MALDTRELFARLIQCEAGGEGTAGMQAVATVIMNRATTTVGEFARVNNGGDVRAARCLHARHNFLEVPMYFKLF